MRAKLLLCLLTLWVGVAGAQETLSAYVTLDEEVAQSLVSA